MLRTRHPIYAKLMMNHRLKLCKTSTCIEPHLGRPATPEVIERFTIWFLRINELWVCHSYFTWRGNYNFAWKINYKKLSAGCVPLLNIIQTKHASTDKFHSLCEKYSQMGHSIYLSCSQKTNYLDGAIFYWALIWVTKN